MKRFLLALLMAGITLVAADQAPKASANCFYKTYQYYDNPSHIGSPCGAWIIYCDGTYREGCVTEYYEVYYGCGCP